MGEPTKSKNKEALAGLAFFFNKLAEAHEVHHGR